MDNYIKVNKELWNQRTEVHYDSEFYDQKGFEEKRNSLNKIELEILGDIKGKSVLHLQCHFGQDTISLAEMGAEAIGVDFSDKAIEKAKETAERLNANANFICCNIFDLEKHLDKKFDLIFTSYGVIGWHPELNEWGKLINKFLNPGGKFLIVEFHPTIWMFDDEVESIQYSYFNKETIYEEFEGTYADPDSKIPQKSYSWNHSLADVFSALIDQNLSISLFKEYDFTPYNVFSKAIKCEEGYQIKGLEGKLPLTFAIEAI